MVVRGISIYRYKKAGFADEYTIFPLGCSWAYCHTVWNWTLSPVTIEDPTMAGMTRTYEGKFSMLSISGFFMPLVGVVGDEGRPGGISVILGLHDGQLPEEVIGFAEFDNAAAALSELQGYQMIKDDPYSARLQLRFC